MGDITQLLNRAKAGDQGAQGELYRAVYAELKRLAQAKLSRASPLTLLDPTSLVQEAYLRMTDRAVPGNDRSAFFAYSAHVMRSVIVDYVRSRSAQKRGGEVEHVTLTATKAFAPMQESEIEALDSAMGLLKGIDERAHQVVEMRYFAGLSIEEVADALSLSTATVRRDFEKARAFLFKAMEP
jgi:RNA polymerase sigma factor (TIGR02999 family)